MIRDHSTGSGGDHRIPRVHRAVAHWDGDHVDRLRNVHSRNRDCSRHPRCVDPSRSANRGCRDEPADERCPHPRVEDVALIGRCDRIDRRTDWRREGARHAGPHRDHDAAHALERPTAVSPRHFGQCAAPHRGGACDRYSQIVRRHHVDHAEARQPGPGFAEGHRNQRHRALQWVGVRRQMRHGARVWQKA